MGGGGKEFLIIYHSLYTNILKYTTSITICSILAYEYETSTKKERKKNSFIYQFPQHQLVSDPQRAHTHTHTTISTIHSPIWVSKLKKLYSNFHFKTIKKIKLKAFVCTHIL